MPGVLGWPALVARPRAPNLQIFPRNKIIQRKEGFWALHVPSCSTGLADLRQDHRSRKETNRRPSVPNGHYWAGIHLAYTSANSCALAVDSLVTIVASGIRAIEQKRSSGGVAKLAGKIYCRLVS